MKILDCESVDSTYKSIESILGIRRSLIDSTLAEFDPETCCEKYSSGNDIPTSNPVIAALMDKTVDNITIDRTCWFHCTRTVETNTFEQGILPLSDCIDAIWSSLYDLIKDQFPRDDWDSFRANLPYCTSAMIYIMRVNQSCQWGPYAWLVREVALKAVQLGNSDFLSASEIVRVICDCFNTAYNINLLELFAQNTKPCIVKFYDDKPRPDCIKKALYYLYYSNHKKNLGDLCETTTSGEGKPIPKDRILKIEFPSYHI
jgi:hypothetical protein